MPKQDKKPYIKSRCCVFQPDDSCFKDRQLVKIDFYKVFLNFRQKRQKKMFKCLKNKFRPANGLQSSRLPVKIHNKCENIGVTLQSGFFLVLRIPCSFQMMTSKMTNGFKNLKKCFTREIKPKFLFLIVLIRIIKATLFSQASKSNLYYS